MLVPVTDELVGAGKRSLQGFFDILLILPPVCLYLHVRIMGDVFHSSA
jgi:hypothetical protein